MALSVYLQDGLFAVKCCWRGDNTWFFPCGGRQAVRLFILRAMEEQDLQFCYMGEQDADYLRREFPGQFRIREREGDNEYLYDRAAQEGLRGRRYSGIRNHMNRVQADFVLSTEILGEGNIAAAAAINQAWKGQHRASAVLEERTACEELLREWKALDVHGVIIKADGEPRAFAAGYPLSGDMFDLSMFKQTGRIRGLSVYAKHAFICSLPSSFTQINAEEDLGLEGLRTMKRQMCSSGQIRMFEGRVTEGGDSV